MFWSKIWFFLVACAAAAALASALAMPRPAAREAAKTERERLAEACDVINILLADNARGRLQLVGRYALDEQIAAILAEASSKDTIAADTHGNARQRAKQLLEEISGAKPDIAILTDAAGRVVTRVGLDEKDYGDSIAGYFAVEDALHGYLRDDLWYLDKKLYLVAASPVIRRTGAGSYVGAVVLGHQVDKELAEDFVKPLRAEVAFYTAGMALATSETVGIDNEVLERYSTLEYPSEELAGDCRAFEPMEIRGGDDEYLVLTSRLPGEAGERDGFFAVFLDRTRDVGFLGTLGTLKKEDLGFGDFPWLLVGLAFVVMVAGGIALMVLEADLPLKKLSANAVELAKGDTDRLAEDRHRGKFGSIARSVNIFIDKLHRDAKSAKKDLDQLLGPAPEDSFGGFDAGGASALPPLGPTGMSPPVAAAPPPSQFKFTDPSPGRAPFALDLPPPPGADDEDAPTRAVELPKASRPIAPKPIALPTSAFGAPAPPAFEKTPPPPIPGPKKAFDDDILRSDAAPVGKRRDASDFDAPTMVADPSRSLLNASSRDEGAYFREVFEEFVALKEQCGESTSSLTFEKFSQKLQKNKSALMDKHQCSEVKFQVYVKDGKAALKATPVKD